MKKDKWKVTTFLPVPNSVCQWESYPKGKTKASSGGKCNELSSFLLHLLTLCRLVWWVTKICTRSHLHTLSIPSLSNITKVFWFSPFCFYDTKPCYLWVHLTICISDFNMHLNNQSKTPNIAWSIYWSETQTNEKVPAVEITAIVYCFDSQGMHELKKK